MRPASVRGERGRIESARGVEAIGLEQVVCVEKSAMALRARGGIGALMKVLTLYGKPDCHLCVEAQSVLRELRSELEFELSEVDITTDEALHRAYFERIPVVALGDEELFEYFVEEDTLRQRLQTIL
jgi:glutaredoxin